MCLLQNLVNYVMTLMLVSLISLSLVFMWTSEVPWHLYCALQTKAREIPLYHTLLWALQCCLCLCFMLLIIIQLVSRHSLQWLLSRLSCILFIMNFLRIYSCAKNIYIICSKVFVKVLLSHLVFNWIAWGQAISYAWGELIRPKRIYFSEHFYYCLSSKLVWFGYN